MSPFNDIPQTEAQLDPKLSGNASQPSEALNESPVENFRPMRVVVIGAGYSGIYCGVRIPERLRNVELCIYEKNAGVGGTWYENRYPGCACDIPSHSYQYSFAPNPSWSKLYAGSPEIREYLTTVAKRFSVDRFVKLSHKVVDVEWRSDVSKWFITVEDLATGAEFVDKADVVISARGSLNDINWPEIPGLRDLQIPVVHSAAWDETQSFKGKRVGVIGSGSSAIQIIPAIQKTKGIQITNFVRSKAWISRPFADNAMEPLGLQNVEFTPEQRARFASDPEYYIKFRTILERDACSVHALTLKGSEAQRLAREDATNLMRERLARKPSIFETLLPNFSIGCRRLTPGPGYLEALSEDNVDVVETPIVRAHPTGLELKDGRKLDFDVLVCATGFRASAPPPFRVAGVGGKKIAERFTPFPDTYLSLATDGFPNYFMMLGPNAAIGTGPLTPMIEAGGDYIIKCIRKMQKENIRKMEVQKRRVDDFQQYATQYFRGTVYLDGCSSWYRSNGGTGDRVSGLWPGSSLHAMETLRSPRWEDFDYVYEGEDGGLGEINRLSWLGNGWSVAQLDSGAGELAYFLQPGMVDIPKEPLPEETEQYTTRPFSY